MVNRIKILNVEIDNFSQEELLAQLKKGVLVTPKLHKDWKLRKQINNYLS